MEQNKIRTYILYGIGEIFLVVIGILIALQVNNWNEERKSNIIEREFMIELLEDAKRDSAFFRSRLDLLTNNNAVTQRFFYQDDSSWSESVKQVGQDSTLFFFWRIVHDSFLINNHPDPIENVSDPVLKESIRAYQNAHNYFSQATELLNRVIEEKGLEIESTYYLSLDKVRNGDTLSEDDYEFLKDEQIQAVIQIFNRLYENAIGQLPDLFERNSILINQLKTRLK